MAWTNLRHPDRSQAGRGTLTISLGNTTTDGNSYYMLMNEQESPVYIISNSLYTEMSKTHL